MSNINISDIIFNTAVNGGMIDYGDTIVVGVSGGADSMCLLHFLASIRNQLKLNLIVAHINHNLRGEEALRDQKFVENTCNNLNVECRVLNADINKISANTGESSEECGRRIRYEFFNELSGNTGKIATAHTLSDNTETILFNIIRGTGLKGIIGIPRTRNNIIRPIIDITRQQVEEYCSENNIEYVTDSTNLTNDYSRNKIRNTVIPVLKDINPSLEQTILRLSSIAKENLTAVTSLAQDLLDKSVTKNGYSCSILSTADKTILKQAIILLLQGLDCKSYEEKHINLIYDIVVAKQGAVQLPNSYTAIASQGILRVHKNISKHKEVNCAKNQSELFKEKTSFVINNKKIKVEIIPKQEFDEILKVHNLLVKNSLDYDIISFDTLIRTRLPKDVFKQQGRGVTKTLKKLFIEAKVPAEIRDTLPVIAEKNKILWACGFGVSEECAVTGKTKNVALIKVE
ncbi:MAG: tRNA lysidine(34) synthetase TilS [Acutalibacteraceae bacterium]|nr:tRNA lysidine(34) synthetase TilS [Acutalibacteraceae bacterium]